MNTLVTMYNTGSTANYDTLYDAYVDLQDGLENPLIYLQAANKDLWQQEPDVTELRLDEYETYKETAADGSEFLTVWSLRFQTQLESVLNLCRTIFICILLSIASIYFTKDANKLVLEPLERMIEKVRIIAKNPLAAATGELEEAGFLTLLATQEEKERDGKDSEKSKGKEKKQEAEYETHVLEKTITKISHLLALGFGEAGAKIISENVADSGDLDPMMSGMRVNAIFGFCDIRNFTDSTEELQTSVMLFVNQIAEIVHLQIDKYGGSANKNIGDAFLLVWKLEDESENERRILADMSLFSFLKIIAKINKFSHILDYRNDERLLRRISDYQVRMGFGLHYGWAIEGAIGSNFKIDASYLSPNVNVASRLEAATK